MSSSSYVQRVVRQRLCIMSTLHIKITDNTLMGQSWDIGGAEAKIFQTIWVIPQLLGVVYLVMREKQIMKGCTYSAFSGIVQPVYVNMQIRFVSIPCNSVFRQTGKQQRTHRSTALLILCEGNLSVAMETFHKEPGWLTSTGIIEYQRVVSLIADGIIDLNIKSKSMWQVRLKSNYYFGYIYLTVLHPFSFNDKLILLCAE